MFTSYPYCISVYSLRSPVVDAVVSAPQNRADRINTNYKEDLLDWLVNIDFVVVLITVLFL